MKAVLDACVLFPTITRGLLLEAAKAGVYTPIWSERITQEWTYAAAKHTDGPLVQAEAALLGADWPNASVALPEDLESQLSLPDPDDRHVLAAAIAARAEYLVTFNLRDFPGRTLATYGVQPWHPDVFLLDALRAHPGPMMAAVSSVLAAIPGDASARAVFNRARLPRFAKAVAGLN